MMWKLIYVICSVSFNFSVALGGFLSDDKNERVFQVGVAVSGAVATVKLICILWRKEQILAFLDDSGHCVKGHEEFIQINKKVNKMMKFGSCLIFMLLVEFPIAIIFWPLFSTEKALPFNVAFPGDWKNSQIVYWIAFAFVTIGSAFNIIGSTLNVVIWYFMMNCSIKYQILGNQFRSMGSIGTTKATKERSKITEVEKLKLFLNELIHLIKIHQNIQEAINRFESCFSDLFFAQITTSGICICGAVYALAFTYIANLLGVAGTDIPIKEIQKLLSPFQLGVNGYGFLVTNNGFVLTHPDLRPVFRGILKPAYNSIDLAEVELLDDNSEPRQFDQGLLEFRELIINQTTGSKFLIVKQHLDNMKRVSRLTRLYYWTPIENTPFTLVISYPKPHGLYRVKVRNEHEIHRWVSEGIDITSFFTGRHWKIHPDWIYCRHNNESFKNPEKELLYFLKRIKNPGWKWKDKTSHYCDRELMQQLVFDAKVTGWFSKNISFYPKDDKGNELKLRFGLCVAFVATQSGLTRWMEFYSNVADEVESDQPFSEYNNRATDEVWYKRAIEQHFIESQSFVFSVPFDVGDAKDTLVTASHAIFLNDEAKSAPAAVVGFQFQHTALYNLFKNITSICGDSCDKEKKCFAEDGKEMEAGCYVLDNNGYVVISPNKEETGKFFGEVRGWLMKRLVEENIYQEVTINDYQAVCFPEKSDGSSGSFLQVPLVHFTNLLKWFGRVLTWAFVHITMMTPAYGYANYDDYGSYADASTLDPNDNHPEPLAEDKMKVDNSVIINRTRPQPCDQVTTLYTLDPPKNGDMSIYDEPANDCERPFVVVPIPNSNLILVVFDINGCPAVPDMKISIIPREEVYSNESLACHRRHMSLYRRRPSSCINRHVNESLVDQCGRGYSITMSVALIGFLVFWHVVL